MEEERLLQRSELSKKSRNQVYDELLERLGGGTGCCGGLFQVTCAIILISDIHFGYYFFYPVSFLEH